jgi:GH15 family glucan-1,4-alpha-glucosidase
MNRLVEVASPLGRYAEHLDVETGRHLGNFPQAFPDLAAVVAAATIVLGDRGEELMR